MRRLPFVLFLGGLILSVAADAWFLAGEQHGEFAWSHIDGFFSLFGFVGCLVIMVVAKFVLGPTLERKEDYYDRRKA